MIIGKEITVYKRNHNGDDVFSYPMTVTAKDGDWIRVEGHFNIPKSYELGLFTIENGDRSIEWFYPNRYYNIFRIHEGDSKIIKGYYCNITRPAIITEATITADDLELDVLISPTGKIVLRDEDEFNALSLPDNEHKQALQAVEQIRNLVKNQQAPFDHLTE